MIASHTHAVRLLQNINVYGTEVFLTLSGLHTGFFIGGGGPLMIQ